MSAKALSWSNNGVAGIVVGLVALIILAVSPQAARAESPAQSYVQNLADQVTAILNSKALTEDAKGAQLRDMIDRDLDMERIAKFTLGKYRRSATDSELSEFVPLFKDYALNLFQGDLSKASGDAVQQDKEFKVKVIGAQDLGGDKGTIVTSAIQTDAPDPVKLNWWVIPSGDRQTIIDVQIEGVWLAQSLREQFVALIDQNGGKVSTVIDHLKTLKTQAAAG